MRAMKDSGVEWIGEIPQEWGTIKFKYLHAGMNTGEGIDKEFWSTNETDKIFYTAGLVPIHTTYLDFPEWKFTEENDLLLARNGTPYVYYPEKGACYTDHIIRAKLNKDVNKRFVQYCLQQSISSIVVESVSIATWSASLWNEQLIPYPSLDKQRYIVEYLDSKCSKIDTIIEKQQAVIEKLKEYKFSVITEAVTKGLNPDVEMKDSGVEWIDKVPKHWKIVKLDDIFDFLGGYAYNSDLYVSESLNQVVRIGNVKNGFLKLDASPVYINDEVAEETSKFKLSTGTILFTMTGTKGKRDYFYTHLITDKDLMEKSLYINQRVGCLISKTDLNAGYFNYLLKDKSILDSIFVYETGTANQGNLGIESIRRTKLQFPSREEQDAIVSHLDKKCLAIDSNIAKKQSIISKLLEYKKSLIYEVVTGKKEV